MCVFNGTYGLFWENNGARLSFMGFFNKPHPVNGIDLCGQETLMLQNIFHGCMPV